MPSPRFTPKRSSFGGPGPWSGHLPFACDLIASVRPSLLVELGSFYGESYFGFCQALEENAIRCACHAVDTWEGDDQGGHYGQEIFADVDAYNSENYGSFSRLLRMTFDEALRSFSDGAIDLLHIDGFHSYEAVRHDFESWLPKVRPGGIILLHDISMRAPGFGVWRFWEELRERQPAFGFTHSAGLGLVVREGPGSHPGFVERLLASDGAGQAAIQSYYAAAAERLSLKFLSAQWEAVAVESRRAREELSRAREELSRAREELDRAREELDRLRAAWGAEAARRIDLENSWSWRLTAPLRSVAGLLRRPS